VTTGACCVGAGAAATGAGAGAALTCVLVACDAEVPEDDVAAEPELELPAAADAAGVDEAAADEAAVWWRLWCTTVLWALAAEPVVLAVEPVVLAVVAVVAVVAVLVAPGAEA
jgi:hypothetical protein